MNEPTNEQKHWLQATKLNAQKARIPMQTNKINLKKKMKETDTITHNKKREKKRIAWKRRWNINVFKV